MMESKDEYARLWMMIMMTLTFLPMRMRKADRKMMRINDEPTDVFSNGYFDVSLTLKCFTTHRARQEKDILKKTFLSIYLVLDTSLIIKTLNCFLVRQD